MAKNKCWLAAPFLVLLFMVMGCEWIGETIRPIFPYKRKFQRGYSLTFPLVLV